MNKSNTGFDRIPIYKIYKNQIKTVLLFTILSFFFPHLNAQQQITSVSPGNWDNPNTWDRGRAPVASDIVVIFGVDVVVQQSVVSDLSISIAGGGVLIVNDVLECNGITGIFTGGTVINNGEFINNETFNNFGTFVNNGTTDNQGIITNLPPRNGPDPEIINNGTLNNEGTIKVYFGTIDNCNGTFTGNHHEGNPFNPCDCILSEWSAWSECTVACGGGTQTRTRTVLQEAMYGGAACVGALIETLSCNEEPCDPCADDQIPPDVSANLLPSPEGKKNEYLIHCSATDNCDDIEHISSIISVPGASGLTIDFKNKNKKKLKFDFKKSKLTVEAPDPQSFLNDVQSAGGISVAEGTIVKFKDKSDLKLTYSFHGNGALKEVKGESMTLICSAIDGNGNSNSDMVTVSGEDIDETENNSDKSIELKRKPGSLEVEFQIRPNPVTDVMRLYYESNQEEDVILNFYNISGTLINSSKTRVSKGYNEIMVSEIPETAGIYLLEVRQADRKQILKFVVQR